MGVDWGAAGEVVESVTSNDDEKEMQEDEDCDEKCQFIGIVFLSRSVPHPAARTKSRHISCGETRNGVLQP